jgi:hypothetical protein
MGRIVGAAIKERAADGPIRLIQLKFQSFNMSATLGGPVPRRLSARSDLDAASERDCGRATPTIAPLSAAMSGTAIAGTVFNCR